MSDANGRPPEPADNGQPEGDHRRPPPHRVAAYSFEAGALAEVIRALPESIALDVATDPDELEGLLPTSRVMLIRAQVLDDSRIEWLRRVVDSHPLRPCFLVLDLSPENVDRVHGLGPGIGPIWTAHLDRLSRLLRETLAKTLLQLFFEAFRARRRGSKLAIRLLETMCLDPSPPTTEKGLARRLKANRKRLRRHWRAHVSRTIPFRVLFDWVTFVRMVERAEARGWPQATLDELASDLGFRKRALGRISGRCCQAPPREILGRPLEALRAFEEWARPILCSAR
jgi:hypothetical protein